MWQVLAFVILLVLGLGGYYTYIKIFAGVRPSKHCHTLTPIMNINMLTTLQIKIWQTPAADSDSDEDYYTESESDDEDTKNMKEREAVRTCIVRLATCLRDSNVRCHLCRGRRTGRPGGQPCLEKDLTQTTSS